jgi:acetoin utilization deacetylase AcuC-like enzyme
MIPLIYHPSYSELPLPDGHRYPIHKYRLLHEQLLQRCQFDDEWATHFHFVEPKPLTVERLTQVHCPDYINALIQGDLSAAKMRRIGFPWSEQLIRRTLRSGGGTAETVLRAIETGCAIHLSGGYHHAHYDFGSGFCLVNDLVIAAVVALESDAVDRVLIVDSDVHHGDGSASLCTDRDDIITLSMHCEKNFPSRKPESDMDIGLNIGVEDGEYLEQFNQVVEMAIRAYQPDVIIYDAGVDIHQDDELGYLNVSLDGLLARDVRMFALAKRYHIPIAAVVGGGYRTDHRQLVELHMQLFKAAFEVFTSP